MELALEDYLELHQVVVELRHVRPALEEDAYVRLAQALVSGLTERGLVKLYEVQPTAMRNVERDLDRAEIREVLRHPERWCVLPGDGQSFYAIAGTALGEQAMYEVWQLRLSHGSMRSGFGWRAWGCHSRGRDGILM